MYHVFITAIMGAKPSTANGGSQSPRTRTFSTGSSADMVTTATPGGFRLMRSLGMDVDNRQRARSLSSVPDLHNSHEAITATVTGFDGVSSTGASPPETDSSSAEEAGNLTSTAATTASLALGRVYAAHSLPSHIWSLNGEFLNRRELYFVNIFYHSYLLNKFFYANNIRHLLELSTIAFSKISNIFFLCF